MSATDLISFRRAPRVALGVLALSMAALQGCATVDNHGDPIEGWNRKVFGFNETVDENVLKPAAKGYVAVTPEPFRTAVGNVFGNLKDVWSTANLFLQGRFRDGTLGVIRVTVNTTFGLGGLIDIATPMQLDRPNEDFGQTLGVWGFKPGAYIVWPLLGPSTLRDSVGIPGDLYFSATTLASTPSQANGLRVLQLVNTRASLMSATNLLDDVALDKYAFVRDAYLQRRQNLIYNGYPPDEDQPEPQAAPEPAEAPAPAASAASVPAVASAAPSAPESTASAPGQPASQPQ
jgi:phospholipid-binding lipoprotein MlaA